MAGEDHGAAGSRERWPTGGVVAQEHLYVLGMQAGAGPHRVDDPTLLQVLEACHGQDGLAYRYAYPLVAKHPCTGRAQALGELPLTPILVVVIAKHDVGTKRWMVGAELLDDRKGLIHHVGAQVARDRDHVRAVLLQQGHNRGQVSPAQERARMDVGYLGDGQPLQTLRQAGDDNPLLPGMESTENGSAVKQPTSQESKEALDGPE